MCGFKALALNGTCLGGWFQALNGGVWVEVFKALALNGRCLGGRFQGFSLEWEVFGWVASRL